MGYLKASRNGLTEDETLDTLSQNDEVMKDFKKRSRTVDIILLPGWVAPITCKFSWKELKNLAIFFISDLILAQMENIISYQRIYKKEEKNE